MTTLDLRGSGATLRLAPNGGSSSVRSFLVIAPPGPPGDQGPKGSPGQPGPPGPALPADQMAALAASFVTATITGDPADPDIAFFLNGVEL